jgi:hypothetical protein
MFCCCEARASFALPEAPKINLIIYLGHPPAILAVVFAVHFFNDHVYEKFPLKHFGD